MGESETEETAQDRREWQTIETKATTGETLYKILQTLIRKYGVRIEFCDKEHTGQKIIEVLNDDA